MSQVNLNLKVERIYKLPETGPVRAFVDLSINESILIKGLRIVHGQKGFFVAMPQEQGKDKRWYDSIRCLSPQIRSVMNETVLTAFYNSAG